MTLIDTSAFLKKIHRLVILEKLDLHFVSQTFSLFLTFTATLSLQKLTVPYKASFLPSLCKPKIYDFGQEAKKQHDTMIQQQFNNVCGIISLLPPHRD